jgi:DNA-binding transcriptional LysR family regulator
VELRQLEHFVAVAEEGHFNRAAARCHIVRSGLSGSIRALERELGSALFVRTTRHVQLTAAGSALLGEARRTLAAAAAAREAVVDAARPQPSRLSIGFSQANRAADAPTLLSHYRALHPAVAISVVRSTTSRLFDQVATGAVDIGLSYIPVEQPANSVVEPLASGSMVLACSYDHRLAGRRRVALRELRGETFITASLTGLADTALDAALSEVDIAPSSRIEVTGLETFFDLVRIGLGVAIAPGPDAGGPSGEMVRKDPRAQHLSDGDRPPVCYVPLADPLPWTYGAILPAAELRTAAIGSFLDLLTGSCLVPSEALRDVSAIE